MMRILALCACLAVACASAQTMYKWKDENGRWHFSENPPPDTTRNAEKIEVKPVGSPTKPPADNWKERELESKQRAAKAGAAQAQNERDEGARIRRCRQAQKEVDGLAHAGRVFELNDKGERVYLDDSKRQAALARWKEEAEKNCN